MNDDATKPKREDVFPPDYDIQADIDANEVDSSGPGCLAWGLMLLFGLIIAIAIVLTATFAGFNAGLDTARSTAVAATNQNIARQCNLIPTDIAAGRFDVVQSRFEALTIDSAIPQCASVFVERATNAYNASLITPTTQAPQATEAATQVPEITAETTEMSTASDSGYDLNALLSEARTSITSGEFEDAISTLDAIIAIDPTFETQTVNGLLFNSLTQRALFLYRTDGGSLAEAILLTDRAAQFGNIQSTDLPFERSVAALYLDAQANLFVNYSLAISLLNQVIALSPNYPRGTGGAQADLFEQYEAYGDALLIGGDACGAEAQFTNALSIRPNNSQLQSKRDNAATQCELGIAPVTPDPNATIDPNAPTSTPTIAPVGQQSGGS